MICEGWKEIPLEKSGIEIIDGDRGKNYPKTSEFYPQGYCLFLNAKNVTGNGFSFDVNNFITKDRDCLLRKGKLKRKDIILTTRGTVGNVAYYNEDVPYNNMRINSGMVILRCPKNVDERFFYLLMRSSYIQKQINLIHTGSAQPQLPISVMKTLQLVLPQLQEQKAIAATLSCLDDKIELNNQMNDTLEQMAQAIFKSWFIDFEPFQDGEFEDSELGMIPKGWKLGTLGDIANITMGQSPKGSTYNEFGKGVIFYQGRTDFGRRYPVVRQYTIEPKRMAYKGDCLLSVRAPVGDLNIAIDDCCIGRGLAALKSKEGANSYLFYQLENLKNQFKVYDGEGTVFGSISKNDLHDILIIVPPSKLIKAFQKQIEEIDNLINLNFQENQILSSLRDTLLPKLMSGEIRVPVESAK